jgi:hypothetical protein
MLAAWQLGSKSTHITDLLLCVCVLHCDRLMAAAGADPSVWSVCRPPSAAAAAASRAAVQCASWFMRPLWSAAVAPYTRPHCCCAVASQGVALWAPTCACILQQALWHSLTAHLSKLLLARGLWTCTQ